MKLYYTDPIKAIWMAKEFGVKIKDYHIECYKLSSEWFCLEDISDIKSPIEGFEKLWIRPESESIFEPKIGDLVNLLPPFDICKYDMKLSTTIDDERHLKYIRTKNFEIIQREDKAFFMPEKDE